MDNSFHYQTPDSDIQQPHGRLANSLRVFKSILHWLANFTRLTDAEQNEAGIYFDYMEDKQISVESFSYSDKQNYKKSLLIYKERTK